MGIVTEDYMQWVKYSEDSFTGAWLKLRFSVNTIPTSYSSGPVMRSVLRRFYCSVHFKCISLKIYSFDN